MIELPVLSDAELDAEKPRARFWRSVSHLKNDAEYQASVNSEFAPEAAQVPGGSSRRQFLQLMGASMALAGLSACRRPVEVIVPYSRQPEEVIEGVAMYYATGMNFRGVYKPLLIESHEGRPTRIGGNVDHPTSRGNAGLFEQGSILNMYDPDRSQLVLNDGAQVAWADFVRFVNEFRITASRRNVAVLAAPSSSPTLAAAKQNFLQAFPNSRWIEYRAEGDDMRTLGVQMAFGAPYRVDYKMGNAEVIFSLDGNFLTETSPDHEFITRGYADSRRIMDVDDTMSRLYVAESYYTTTGSMADHRVRVRSSDIPAFAAALAAQIRGTAAPGTPFDDHPVIVAAAEDLVAAGPNALIVAGDAQPPEVHALAMALNSELGAIGNTVRFLDIEAEPITPQADKIDELLADLRAGTLDTVIMLDVNPVLDLPELAELLRRVDTTIHLGMHVDETASSVRWHLPITHYLEAWEDGRSYDGTLSASQPLIAPLYEDAKSTIEVLNLMATGLDNTGYDLVRQTWRDVLPADKFESSWRRVLHDGYLPNTPYPDVTDAVRLRPEAVSPALPVAPEGVELVFRLSGQVLDGSYANNAWMQELPDVITKIVWDNVATMSPKTAAALGVQSNLEKGQHFSDSLTLTLDGTSVTIPVWILPGHADNSITLDLGFGRQIASSRAIREAKWFGFDTDHKIDIYGQGAIGSGVGVNVSPLRVRYDNLTLDATIAKADVERYMIATTQDHGVLNMEKRPLAIMATMSEYQANPTLAKDMVPTLPKAEDWDEYPTLWEDRAPATDLAYKDNPYYQNQWGMVIDLNTCMGCNACIVACQAENNVQVVGKDQVSRGREMHWLRLDRYFISDSYEIESDNPKMMFLPVSCQHCENAPCESVCPVAATYHSPDGTNQMVYNRCIGTRYCANNCPYKVRRFNFYNWTKDLPLTVQMVQNPNVTVRSRGVMEKCTYCIQRIRKAQQQASLEKRNLRDGDIVSACQQACAADSIYFGDLNDPNSKVVKMKENNRRYELLPQINVKPRTSYMARIRNPNEKLEPAQTSA
ncbi:MAG: TAT-variant-translocated molybdopterin oxidoreductase [Bacteroidota bacterium]